MVYFHPWEIDPQQPRIERGVKICLRHYTNLGKMEKPARSTYCPLIRFMPFGMNPHVLDVNTLTGEDVTTSDERK